MFLSEQWLRSWKGKRPSVLLKTGWWLKDVAIWNFSAFPLNGDYRAEALTSLWCPVPGEAGHGGPAGPRRTLCLFYGEVLSTRVLASAPRLSVPRILIIWSRLTKKTDHCREKNFHRLRLKLVKTSYTFHYFTHVNFNFIEDVLLSVCLTVMDWIFVLPPNSYAQIYPSMW